MAERPAGLAYEPDFLSLEEERALLGVLAALEFEPIEMRGQVARRTALHFGVNYDYDNPRRSGEGEPFSDWLVPVRERAASLAGVEPCSATRRRRRSAGTATRRLFGKVVGVSLGASSRMRFRQPQGDRRDVFELVLEPRSGYVLAGAARWQWQHSIPAVKKERYSITFRTLRTARSRASAGSESARSSSPG